MWLYVFDDDLRPLSHLSASPPEYRAGNFGGCTPSLFDAHGADPPRCVANNAKASRNVK